VQSEEGPIGNVIVSQKPILVTGRNRVEQALSSLSSQNSRALSGLFEKDEPPGFAAICPLVRLGETEGIALLFLDDITDSERGEWERLVTLATGLYSLRLTIDKLQSLRGADDKAAFGNERVGMILNTVNNHLSAVIGNAELAATDGSLDGRSLNHVQGIIAEAQRAADYLESALGTQRAQPAASRTLISLNDVALSAVNKSQISEGLYLVGGRTREIQMSFDHNNPQVPDSFDLKSLIAEALSRFSAHAEDEDFVTVSTYRQDGDACIDISRHRRNFPAVERVAGFGEYINPQRGLEIRPGDTFLSHIVNKNVLYSYDRFSSAPSYISFRFPSAPDQPAGPLKAVQAKILAIDDQPVILELISAMCQTLGYEVKSVSNGPEGIALAEKERFDVILTDLAMPDMSGLEVARRVKVIQPDTPIILVTGWEVTIDRARLEEAGISEVLYKPFRIEQLTSLVKSTAVSRSS
jgi:CheY-like chemotaxis protein